MNRQLKNMFVGIFVLGAISICVATIMFLKPSMGDGKERLYVRFSDIGNIHLGTRVRFAGKPVGEVVAMEEIHDAREQPTDELGRVYFYQLTLHVDSKVKVYNTDEISIQTSGLLGEKSIAITPKAPPKGVTPKRVTDQPIYADSVDPFQNALMDFSDLASNMEEAFKEITHWIKDHGEQVATTIQAAGAALEEVDEAVATINKTGVVHQFHKGLEEFNTALGQVQVAMQQMEDQHTFKNFGTTMQNLTTATHSADLVLEDVAKGKGTLGKLIEGNELYLQANAIMTKANTLMNDFNQYGILFHLNKQWQRTHLQRLNALNSLNSPQGFHDYFQTEVNDINASMTRLSILLNKAQDSPKRTEILHSDAFKKDFAELLRKADQLNDNLRLYNEQLNAPSRSP